MIVGTAGGSSLSRIPIFNSIESSIESSASSSLSSTLLLVQTVPDLHLYRVAHVVIASNTIYTITTGIITCIGSDRFPRSYRFLPPSSVSLRSSR